MKTTQTRPPKSVVQPRITIAPELMGNSEVMRQLRHTIEEKKYDQALLILGRVGTGKAEVARELHRRSGKPGPFIEISGAMFNHPARHQELAIVGVAEGPNVSHIQGGLRLVTVLEEAENGTLLICDVDQLPMQEQFVLSTFMQNGVVGRPPPQRSFDGRVRIIATSHIPLEPKVATGTFRRDLFEALSSSVIRTPALSEHPEDIPMIVEAVIRATCIERGRKPMRITKEALALLVAEFARDRVPSTEL